VVVIAFGAYKLLVSTRVDKFEIEITFRVPTLAVEAMRFVVNEFKFEIEMTFRVPTFAVVEMTFVVVTELDTARLDSRPTEVILG
jgi:hypothetical protein